MVRDDEPLALPSSIPSWPTSPAELFDECDLPTPRAVRYATLPRDTCAATAPDGVVTIDRAQCPDVKLCCGLGHETVHVRQFASLRSYCAGNSACVEQTTAACRALAEAEAYLTECNQSGCGNAGSCGPVRDNCAQSVPAYCQRALGMPSNPCACGARNGTCGGTCPSGQACSSTASGCGCVTPTPAPSPSPSSSPH